MSALAEALVALAAGLIQLSMFVVEMAITPLRFLFSSRFRVQALQRWQGRPILRAAELVGGSAILVLFAAMLWFWVSFSTRPKRVPDPRETEELERRVLQFFRDVHERRQQ